MHFALALLIAVNFWGARDVRVPCHPVAVPGANAQLPLDPGVTLAPWPVLMAATSGCRVLISTAARDYRTDHDLAPWYCANVAHEVGHLAELEHTATGIMAPTETEEAIPYDCVHWRTYARRHHIPIRR